MKQVVAWVGWVALGSSLAAYSQGRPEPGSVEGLALRLQSTDVVLTWPSDPRESFLVLSRSNAAPETLWTVLANPLRAAPLTNRTTFHDAGGGLRARSAPAGSSLLDLYRVLVVPDFWFNLEGIRLDGGPLQRGEDFIPFYYGNPGRDGSTRIFGLHVELVIDAESATAEAAIALQGTAAESIERVNFGTRKDPRYAYVTGFWLQHELLANGSHTLQLRTSLHLNNIVGLGEQFLTLTNSPVRIWTTNAITFPTWVSEVGANLRIQAQSAEPRVNWRINIRDHQGALLARKTGTTTNGEIGWTWDLRDRHGTLHDTLEGDPFFQPTITTWPMGETPKGSQLLLELPKPENRRSWWDQRLGSRFVRKPPTLEEYRHRAIYAGENPLMDLVPPRPWRLP
jgi:hypothetical protein